MARAIMGALYSLGVGNKSFVHQIVDLVRYRSYNLRVPYMIRSSSVVEQFAVNELVVGSSPTSGARYYFKTTKRSFFVMIKV